jgi:hypothetical protein
LSEFQKLFTSCKNELIEEFIVENAQQGHHLTWARAADLYRQEILCSSLELRQNRAGGSGGAPAEPRDGHVFV